MSKLKTTIKPPNCLNCNHPIDEQINFCPNCGQKALPDHLTFKYFFQEFVNNVFSFDSRFLITIKYLILKPSFLSKEFIIGRRKGYINPIQLFMLTSFLYFFVNSVTFLRNQDEQADLVSIHDDQKNILNDSIRYHEADSVFIIQDGENTDTLKNSDMNQMVKKGMDFNELEDETQEEMISTSISYAVFFLMPILAFYLGFLFKRKNRHYLENIVFSLHFHAFYYVIGIVMMLFDRLLMEEIAALIINVIAWVYILIAAKRFYQFSWTSTIFRLIGLTFIYGFTVSIILLISIMISIFI